MSSVWGRRMASCFPRVSDQRKATKTQIPPSLELHWYPVRLPVRDRTVQDTEPALQLRAQWIPGLPADLGFLRIGIMPLSLVGSIR